MSLPRRIVCLVHGGAGTLRDEAVPVAVSGVSTAAKLGFAHLLSGSSALDAVEAAVSSMEDDPFFNAGRGSVLNRAGVVEMDALIADGARINCGAVTMIKSVRHPVQLARRVMLKTPHVFIAGRGAEALARVEGLEMQDPSFFVMEVRKRQLERALQEEREHAEPEPHVLQDFLPAADAAVAPLTAADLGPVEADEGDHDTVGAVAIDASGNVAAATSTGGLTAKWAGRIGDTPVFGAGGYADNAAGACSATGTGEFIIRALLAKSVCDAYEALLAATPATAVAIDSPATAATAAVAGGDCAASVAEEQYAAADARAAAAVRSALMRMHRRVGGPGAGLVYVSPEGGVGVGHTSPRMSWAACAAALPLGAGAPPAAGADAALFAAGFERPLSGVANPARDGPDVVHGGAIRWGRLAAAATAL